MRLQRFCQCWERRALRLAVYTLFIVIFLYLIVIGTRRALFGSSEFLGFRQIVQVSVVMDRNQYDAIWHVRGYPPPFPLMWAPFGLVPYGRLPDPDHVRASTTPGELLQLGMSAAVLLLTMTLLAVWSVLSISEACGKEGRWPACFPVLLLLLSGSLMANSIARCETDVFVLALVAGAMLMMFGQRRRWTAGFLLGAAAVFKLTPGLFGLYLLCRRDWRGVGGMLAGGIAFGLVLPLAVWGPRGTYTRYRGWADEVLLDLAREGTDAVIGRPYRSTNQSLRAAAVRYLSRYNAGTTRRPRYVNVTDYPLDTARKAGDVLKLGILALLAGVWGLTARNCGRERERLLFALGPPAMLLISPVSVGGHFAIMAVPFGALAAFAIDHEEGRQGRLAAWGLMLAFLLTHLMGVPILKQLSAATLGAVVALGFVLYLACSARSSSAASAAQDQNRVSEGPA